MASGPAKAAVNKKLIPFYFKYSLKSNSSFIKPITPFTISLAPSIIRPTPNLMAAPAEKNDIAAPATIYTTPRTIAPKAPQNPLFFFFFYITLGLPITGSPSVVKTF